MTGKGRYTADLQAALWVRFVRSQVASGRIDNIGIPDGAMVITAADLAALKPICPMLHKFDYVPVGQPILADGVVRFVGEAVAAAVAASAEEAEDICDNIEVEITPLATIVDTDGALADGAALVHPEARGNVIVEGTRQDAGVRRRRARARSRSCASRRARGGRTPRRWRRARRHAAFDPTPAASRSPARPRCRTCCAPPSPTRSACRNRSCA